jgi:hypothetical protein
VGRALRDSGHAIAVCGTTVEQAEAQQVASAIGHRAVSLAGRTSLPRWRPCAPAPLSRCAKRFGARAPGRGLRRAHGGDLRSTSSAWTAPRGQVRVVQRAPVCSPCFQRTCRIGYRCLTAIEARDVLRRV